MCVKILSMSVWFNPEFWRSVNTPVDRSYSPTEPNGERTVILSTSARYENVTPLRSVVLVVISNVGVTTGVGFPIIGVGTGVGMPIIEVSTHPANRVKTTTITNKTGSNTIFI